MSTVRLRCRLVGPVALVAMLMASAGLASSAGAALAPGYGPVGSGFNPGYTGNDAGQVAVDDATGNILTTDTAGARVIVLAPDVSPGATASALTEFAVLAPFGIAVDQSTHAVYVSEGGPTGQLERFVSDGAPTPTYIADPTFTAIPLSNGHAPIAVDPTTHDVLVADGNQIKRFTASGMLIRTLDGSNTPTGAFRNVLDVKAGATSTYVADYRGLPGTLIGGDGKSRIEQFDSQGAYVRTIAATDAPAILGVDADRDRLVAVGRTGLNQNGAQLSTFESGAVSGITNAVPAGGAYLSGVAVDGGVTQRAYVTVSALCCGKFVYAFVPAPGAHADSFTTADPRVAHLTGAVNPEGKATTAHFEYCSERDPCATDPSIAWTATPDFGAGAGTADVAMVADIADLQPHTQYQVRIAATDTETNDYSNTATVTTADAAPLAVTGAVSDLSSTTATAAGTITPYGIQATYYFEYGETTSYGSRQPVDASGIAGNGFTARALTRKISGLKPSTTYHYRIVGINSAGLRVGADQTLVTDSTNTDVRGYEMVSPVDKQGIAVDSAFAGARTSDDGNAIIYGTAKSSFPGAQTAPFVPRVLGLRSDTGWTSTPLELPLENLEAGHTLYFAVLAASSDARKALVLSKDKLTDGAVQGGWNLYIRQPGATPDITFVASDNRLGGLSGETGEFHLVGVSADLRTTVFTSDNKMWEAVVGQGVSLVSRLPDGTLPTDPALDPNGVFTDVHQVSDDGSRIYFNLGAGGSGGLYLRKNGTVTVPISVSQRPGAPSTPVQALLIGASPDGRYVEFTTACGCSVDGLTPSAPDGPGIYRYDTVLNELMYLAPDLLSTLAKIPRPAQSSILFQDGAIYYARPGEVIKVADLTDVALIMRGSDDGRYFVFTTGSRLTSFDNTGHLEAYRYDSLTSELTCVSCRGDAGPAMGGVQLGVSAVNDAAFAGYKSRAVLNNGTVFFDTLDPLVGADINGTRDVYEYRDGRASLISRGKLATTSQFVDATSDGSNVFFTTDDRLVGQDQDSIVDEYDARIGGGLPSQSPPPGPTPCTAAECRESDSGPVTSAPSASQSSASTGNVRPLVEKKALKCKKGFAKKSVNGKQRCVKKSKPKVKAKAKKKSHKPAKRSKRS
jgi:hypothetical protein